jgi:hypothetical protein
MKASKNLWDVMGFEPAEVTSNYAKSVTLTT